MTPGLPLGTSTCIGVAARGIGVQLTLPINSHETGTNFPDQDPSHATAD
jgi:hypothetical protein